jgi:hypothetical protein
VSALDVPLTTSEEEMTRAVEAHGGETYEIRRLYAFPEGSLSSPALSRALEALASEQPVLRSTFPREGRSGEKRVHGDPTVGVRDRDYSGTIASLAGDEAGLLDYHCPLEPGLPAALALIRCADADALAVRLAHEAFDEVSLGLLLRGLDRHSGPAADAAPLSAADYRAASMHHNDVCRARSLSSAGYWREWARSTAATASTPRAHDVARQRFDQRSGQGARLERTLSAAEAAAVAARRRRERVTPAAQFLAAYCHALTGLLRIEGQSLMLAVPISTRTDAVTWRLMGYFAKLTPIVMRSTVKPAATRDEAQRCLWRALAHAHTPVGETAKHVVRCREMIVAARWPPPFVFTAAYRDPSVVSIAGARGVEVPLPRATSRAHLTCALRIGHVSTKVVYEFDTGCFDREDAMRLLDDTVLTACSDG